ncbi:ER membrane protein complex subunit 7 homolog isoform X2 [Hyalella azteca]|uniref:ER membrane protein complex subunit 7 homolog isoform X2 n=1 Tax=Hyalella azteca TaxID=294128 RepID=A0A8B7P4N5_HYAAZ|nr:ER membrane protein complex subunit 7 homolog isoform X2 [Hyalella azteca]
MLVLSRLLVFVLASFSCLHIVFALSDEEGSKSVDRFTVEGIVERPLNYPQDEAEFFAGTRIYTNTGYQAFLKANGSFVLHNLPWGSHFIHVVTPNILYAPIRVDINSKGKWRPRKVNYLQPSKVEVLSTPLKFTALGPVRYFEAREQWRITDLLFNPMVLMTVVPLGLMLLMPKLSDPETRREVESQFQLPKTEAPDLSEMVTNFLGMGSPSTSSSSGPAAGTACDARRPGRGGARAARRKDK